MVWCRVTRHPRVFRGLTGYQRDPRDRGVTIVFLVLYIDDILLIGNDIEVLSSVKGWLQKQFDMKDLGEANYILGIKLLRDRKNKVLDYLKLYI